MALFSVSGYDRLKIRELANGTLDEMNPRCPVVSPLSNIIGQSFEMPAQSDPKDFVATHFGNDSPGHLQFLKGTTTLAFVYKPKTDNDKGGIIVAVDSRASSGKYIGTQRVMKVLEVSDHLLATMAGGAADCQFWTRVLAKQCRLFELQNKEKISVAAASKLLANMLYGYKGMGLSMGTMVAGWDKRGPSIYYIDDEGVRVKGNLFSVGSGSLNAYGVLDSFHKETMSDEEAIDLGKRAIMHATFRDAGSGGVCNVYHISEKGFKYQGRSDVSDAYYNFMTQVKRETYEPKL